MNADNQIPIDMLRIGRNLRSEEEVKAIQRNKDETRQQIRIWYEYFFVIAGFMLLLRMSLLDSIPPYIPFVILAFYQIKVLFHTIFLIKRSIDSLHRSHQLKELIISTCTLSTYIFTICYTANVFKYLFLISGPILLTNLISIFKKTNVNSKCLEFAHKSESTYRWVFGTTLLFAGLKELKLVNWNWFYIFWPIWLFVCILLMVGIGEIIFLGKQIFRSIRGRGPCSETLCPVWMIYITFGVSCCVCYLFYEIALNAEGIPNGKIPDALLVLLLYFIGLFTLTFLLSTFLQEWFEKHFYHGAVIIHEGRMIIPPVPPPIFPPTFVNVEEFPKRMHKISNTFYSVDKPEVNEIDHSDVEIEVQDDEELRREATVESKTCSICCTSDSDTIIMNCGHSGICYMCSRALWENFKKCHICRENIEALMQFKDETEKTVEIVRAMKLSL